MDKAKLKKEVLETLKFIGILVLIYIVGVGIFTYIPPLNQYHMFALKTNSMEPIINVGDIVVTREIAPDQIQVGDIMAFRVDITNDGNDDVVVHYIDEILPYEGKLIFKTKPHISDQQDRWTIEEEDLVGIYKYQIDYFGKILLFVQSWIGRIIILIDIVIISIIYDILFGKKDKKKQDEVIESEESNEDLEQTKTP